MPSKSTALPLASFPRPLSSDSKQKKTVKFLSLAVMAMVALAGAGASAVAQGVVYDPTIITYAGTGSLTVTSGGNGGQATAAGINNPEGIAFDFQGNTYIADYYNNQIRVISPAGIINVFAGTGVACPNPTAATGACGDGGAASAATFNNPTAMQFDTLGNLYIADLADQRVRKITATNGVVTGASIISTVVGTGATGNTGNTGVATAATLYEPHGLVLDQAGDLWIANQGLGNSCTIGYVPATAQVRTIGGTATALAAGHYYLVAGQAGTCGYISDANGTTQGTATRLTSPTNLALDSAGNLYIGDYGNGRIRKLNTTTGVIVTVAGTGYQACPQNAPTTGVAQAATPTCGDGGLATAAALNGPTGVFVDAADNILIGDAFGARVREVNGTTGIISTISGTSQQCTNISQTNTFQDGAGNVLNFPNCGDGTPATKALVSFPILITVNPGGNILYVDQYDNKVREIVEHLVFPNTNVGASSPSENLNLQTVGAANTIVTSITSNNVEFVLGTETGCVLGGTTGNAPGSICQIPIVFTPKFPGVQQATITVVTNGGTFTFGVSGVGVAPEVILSPGTLSTVAGTGVAGYTGTGGPATAATLNGPRANVFFGDALGDYYFADTSNNVIREVTADGVLHTVAGTGTAGYTGDGGLATAATLNTPAAVAVDSAGNIYIADYLNKVIRKVNAGTGIISTYATGFSGPAAIDIDAETANIFVADPPANVVRKVNASSQAVTIVAGTGVACTNPTATCGDGGAATSAQLNGPNGVIFDTARGNLYIADLFDNRIRKVVVASGIITTPIGTGAAGYTGDNGPATAATLSAPYAVNVDAAGDIFIAETGNNVIRFVSGNSGIINTFAGNGTACTTVPSPACGDGGPENVSALANPQGVTVGPLGNVYITEQQTNRIRKLDFNGPTTLPFSPAAAIGSVQGPLEATLYNIGNATLTFTTPASPNSNALLTSTGPTGGGASNAFAQSNTTTCGPIFSTTTTNNTLAPGSDCLYFVTFTPDTIAGNYTGTLVETDNSLYSGQGNPAYPAPLTQTVTLTASAIAGTPTGVLTFTPATPTYGTPVTLTETLTPPGVGVTPTGTVQFSQNGFNIGTPVTLVNGVASITTANLPVGSDPVKAVYTPATTNYTTITSTNTVPVTKAPIINPTNTPLSQSFTVTTNPATSPTTQIFGMPVILTYTVPVAVGNTAPTGPVVFSNAGTTLGTCTTFVAGTTVNAITPYSCSLSTSALPVGNPDTVTATYTTNDPNYAGGAPALTAPAIITAAAGMAALAVGPNPATFGTPVTLTETVTPINGVCPAGPVTFLNNGTALTPTAPIALTNGSCVASLTTSTLPVGTDDITATIPTSGSFGPITSGPVALVVNKANAPDTLASSPNPSTFGQSVTITDTIPTVNGVAPTGTVNFYDYTTLIGTGTVNAQGVATLSTTTLPVGVDSLTGVYSGDGNYATITAGPVNQVVNTVATTPTLSVGPNPTTFGTPVTIVETIPTVNGTPATGTVVFSQNGTAIGTGTINAQGVATIVTSTLPVGTDPITATYGGNTNYAPVNSGPVNEVVNKANGPDTLAVNPDPAVFGATVTITDTVPTVGGVVPTGTVTFTNNGTTIGTAPLVNGVATLTTTTLPVGSDPISAAYGGDGNYAPVTTGPVNEVITTGNTTPVLAATPNPTTFGTPVTITESIPGINGVTPTGTVKFFNNGTQIGTGTVTNGVATLLTSTLPIGTDPITATYSGDPNYGTANSGPLNVVINKAAPTDTFTALPSPTTFGTAVTATFTVPAVNSVAPTGVVTFFNGTTPIGTGTLSAAGVATLTTSTLPVGSDLITAKYPGDNTYAPASLNATVVVGLAPGTGDLLSTSPNPSTFGSPVLLTESLPTVGGVAPSGSVVFTYNGATIGTGTVTNGVATVSTSTLPVGSDPITAVYSGDSNYATVTSGPVTQVVNAATAGATLAAGPNPATFGTPVTITETLVPINGTCPPGPVSFFSNGTAIGTGTVNAQCVATITTSTLPVGSDAITATAPASGSFTAVTSGPLALVINKANGPDTLASSPNPSTFGQSVTITDTIPTVGGVAPTGTVNFYDYTTLIGTGTVNAQGVATLSTTTLPVGVDSLTGVYSGDGNYATITAGPVNQVVNTVPTVPTLAVGPNPTTFGTPVTITETIPTVNGTPATGTVVFSQSGTVIGTGPINAQGVATIVTSTLPVGTDPITATYGGNTNYAPVNSGPVNEVVNKANGPDTLAVNPDPAVFGTTVTITDTVPTVGGVAPTGTVTFTNNGTAIGTAPIVNGVATVTSTTLPVGSDPITAVYSGDSNYAPVTTGPVNEIITVGNTTPVLGATPNPTTFGTQVAITESIPGINGVAPTGTVKFFNNGTQIGTGTVTNGVATLLTSTLPIGTDPITATYSGDTNYATANSGPLNVVVNKAAPTDTVTAAPNNVPYTTPVTLTFTVPLVNGVAPTGVVSFYTGTTLLGTGTVSATGVATLITTTLPEGTDTITAKYPGDNTYAAASPTTTETITAASGTPDTVSVSPNPTTFGSPTAVTFCIPVLANAPVPTGTVTFSAGGITLTTTPIAIGTTPTTVNGQSCYIATTTTTNLPVGSPTIVTATYTPGANSGYGPDAPTATVTVNPVSPISTLTSGPSAPTCGTAVTLTDVLTAVNGVPFTGGTVQFYDNGVPIGPVETVSAGGTATLTTTVLTCGANAVTAIFTPAANSPYSTSTGGPTGVAVTPIDFSIAATPPAQVVNPGDTAVYTIALSGVTVPYGSPVTLSATGLPPGATLKFGLNSLIPGLGPTTTSMTIVTSPTQGMLLKRNNGVPPIYYGLLLLPLMGLGAVRRRLRGLPKGLTYCLAALALLGGLGAVTGCGGGYFGPAPNTYTITVTGTSGTLIHSTTVTLEVR